MLPTNLISSAIVSEVKTIGTPLGTSRWCLLTLLTCQTQQTIHCILKIKIDFVRELIFQMKKKISTRDDNGMNQICPSEMMAAFVAASFCNCILR